MFRIDIYDRAFRWKAPLGDFKKVEATLRWNAVSELTLTLAASHHRAALLAEPGARIRVKFRDVVFSGPVRQRKGAGPGATGEVVFTAQSDFRVLRNFLGWPNPGGTLAQQGDEGAYYSIGRRPAETVLKDAVRRNIVQRAGYSKLTVAPDQGRGAVTAVTFRMHPLADRLFPAVSDAGLGVTVAQEGAGLVLDCHVPAPYPNVLTEQSRVIQKWEFSGVAPEATRGVIGAQGQGELREFIGFSDAARESAWGDVVEVFRDARDTSDSTTHAQRGQAALEESAARGSLTVELAESGNFQMLTKKGLNLGQVVTARVGPGIEVTEVLHEVDLSFTPADGLKLSATIGPKDDPLDNLMQAITALSRGVLDLKAGT
ncbi:siphovirus ReqiPepy6 Gp37-like family protein [Arthrobacter koreensis]|uniref:Siphovirus ReqiPepy6 Gp37-like family protein n=1 Tax=Arthrobacter koreensis TaxID=199136 RepID=A0ABY6FQN6_9MICC|nr:siphovirus ReqiPepy6 Gp37-like family protein [Arthrobacter koreensis]UYB35509.1 siphovirus ReqiPepy6 Gp37-like family protein [Arthrobacter koreensis]